MMNSGLKPLIRIYYFSPNNGPTTLTVSYMLEISLLIFLLICKLQGDGRWQITPHFNTKTLQKKPCLCYTSCRGTKKSDKKIAFIWKAGH